ncbi:hypothetical protein A9Q81_24270 [Gammaproteobacteria bacterium 42_54_T18]|nr:hypothetical protein A9Q81_24270 [Gammaproteobacteria bacterium 42_54_T18]
MKLGRCPTCHATVHLDAMVQDEAGRELMATLAKLNSKTGSSVLQYVGLFRPAKSDLNNGRALKLLTEALDLTANLQLLTAGCDATVRNIYSKRQSGETVKPLTNHNYLKQVLTGLKEQFNHPINGAKKASDMGNAQVKHYHQLSDAENDRLRQEQLAKFRQSNQGETV